MSLTGRSGFTNLKEFGSRIPAWYQESLEELMKTQKKLALDVFRGVVKETPVDTGRARAARAARAASALPWSNA